jgi:hypothetical protein
MLSVISILVVWLTQQANANEDVATAYLTDCSMYSDWYGQP